MVISALQVEKHPLTTPGPYTPPSSKHHFHSTAIGVVTAFQMTPQSGRRGGTTTNTTFSGTSSNGSPIPPRPNSCASGSYYGYYGSPRFSEHYRGSPKPHSSPKMKLRCLLESFLLLSPILHFTRDFVEFIFCCYSMNTSICSDHYVDLVVDFFFLFYLNPLIDFQFLLFRFHRKILKFFKC